MYVFFEIAVIVFAYLLGSIPFGYLIGKMHGIDVRTVGSRNIGATNVTRTVGKMAGKVCFLLDFLKGAVPVGIALLMCRLWTEFDTSWFGLAVALAAIIGHIFPVFLKFRGGKGVSTAAGALLALAPFPLLVALVVWLAVFMVSRYVSLASIAAAAALPVVAWVFWLFQIGNGQARTMPTLCFLTLISIVTIIRHHANIRRLLDGTESRFGNKK